MLRSGLGCNCSVWPRHFRATSAPLPRHFRATSAYDTTLGIVRGSGAEVARNWRGTGAEVVQCQCQEIRVIIEVRKCRSSIRAAGGQGNARSCHVQVALHGAAVAMS